MIFLITEIYMSLIMLISLIVLSLKKENYKKKMQQVILYYITYLIKGTLLICMINYIYIIKNFFDKEKMYVREFILII